MKKRNENKKMELLYILVVIFLIIGYSITSYCLGYNHGADSNSNYLVKNESNDVMEKVDIQIPTISPITQEKPTSTVSTPTDELVFGVLSDSDYVLLCNAVGREYGSDSTPIEEKAKVVEVIINRVESPSFPDTIRGVLTQPNQFACSEEYVNLNTFSERVTPSVEEAVHYYFEHKEEFQDGYLFFKGDGTKNYFSCKWEP